MKMIKNKKIAQISIFIILSFAIIFLMIFLIFSTKDSKINDLEDSKNDVQYTNVELRPIKDQIDYCLDNELKKATIIAGLRGGFIYNYGEEYIPSKIPENTYSRKLIGNLNLNWNYLESQTLLHSNSNLFFPLINDTYEKDINGNGTIDFEYFHSIKEDFEKFIKVEFLKCLNINAYENNGYKINYEKYSSKIEDIIEGSENFILVNDLNSNIGDEIEIILEDNIFSGKVREIIGNKVYINISTDTLNLLKSNIDLRSVDVLNLNSTVNVKVDFKQEKIGAKLYFPAKIKKDDFNIAINNVYSEINVRFERLYRMAEFLLNKKVLNKKIQLNDSLTINNLLKDFYYIKKSDLKDINFVKNVVSESDEQKIFLYSLVDEDSKILGKPFVFNFGYKNDAPIIDIESLNPTGLDDDSVLFVIAQNVEYTYDLKSVTTEIQNIDKIFNTYFEENSYHATDADYELTRDGIITFTAHKKKDIHLMLL